MPDAVAHCPPTGFAKEPRIVKVTGSPLNPIATLTERSWWIGEDQAHRLNLAISSCDAYDSYCQRRSSNERRRWRTRLLRHACLLQITCRCESTPIPKRRRCQHAKCPETDPESIDPDHR